MHRDSQRRDFTYRLHSLLPYLDGWSGEAHEEGRIGLACYVHARRKLRILLLFR